MVTTTYANQGLASGPMVPLAVACVSIIAKLSTVPAAALTGVTIDIPASVQHCVFQHMNHIISTSHHLDPY